MKSPYLSHHFNEITLYRVNDADALKRNYLIFNGNILFNKNITDKKIFKNDNPDPIFPEFLHNGIYNGRQISLSIDDVISNKEIVTEERYRPFRDKITRNTKANTCVEIRHKMS
jgi:hypothetical protein